MLPSITFPSLNSNAVVIPGSHSEMALVLRANSSKTGFMLGDPRAPMYLTFMPRESMALANAMLSLGMNVRYIGALGSPNINPVFDEFARKTSAISLCEPGITTALEFKDGKVMLGNTLSSVCCRA